MRSLFLLTLIALLAVGMTGCNSCGGWRPGQMLFGNRNCNCQPVMITDGCNSGCCNSGCCDGGMVSGTVMSSGCNCGN